MTLPAARGAHSLGVLIVLISVFCPAQAYASSAVVTDASVVYTAAAGETNNVGVHALYDADTDLTNVTFVDTGATIVPGSGCSTTAPGEVTCEGPGYLDDITVRLMDGNDVLVASGDTGGEFCAVDVFGGPGADTLVGGPGDDCLDGGNDADRLEGGPGLDSLDGGKGNDLLLGGSGQDNLEGGGGADRMEGGSGHDLADYSGNHTAVRVTLDGRRNDGVRGSDLIASDVEGVIGSPKGDVLIGNGHRNSLWGYVGNDVIRGHAGNDYIGAGWGDDDVAGGPGNDILIGTYVTFRDVFPEPGRDWLRGGAGNDRIIAYDSAADRLVDGGPGRDRAEVDPGIDPVRAIEVLRYSTGYAPDPPALPWFWWGYAG